MKAQPKLPDPREAKTLPAAPEQGNTVGDWKSGPKTGLAVRDGALSVISGGNDPIIYSDPLPAVRGPYFLDFRMSSLLPGPLEIFWTTKESPAFNNTNKVAVGEVSKAFDGKYRYYLVALPDAVVAPLTQIRIDPGTGPGEALFEYIRLRSVTGKIYKEWKVAP